MELSFVSNVEILVVLMQNVWNKFRNNSNKKIVSKNSNKQKIEKYESVKIQI